MTVRVVGEILAGVMMIARGLLGIWSHLFSFSVLLDVWFVVFGVLAVCLELRRFQTAMLFQAVLKQYARFLTYPVGRAVFYLLIGVLMLSRAELPDLVVGGLVTSLAISLLVSAKRISRVFNELHSAKYTEGYIMDKFWEFDADRSGELDSHELAALCKSLGAPLSKNELEVCQYRSARNRTHASGLPDPDLFHCMQVALFVLDEDGDGKITAIEFLKWWKSTDYSLIEAYI